MTGPVKIGHVGTCFCLLFQAFITHNVLYHYTMALQFSAHSKHLIDFMMQVIAEYKYSVPVLTCRVMGCSCAHMPCFRRSGHI